MCMSSAPSKMSDTRIYAGKAKHNDRDVHVLAYQNSAESETQNAMILPFPTSVRMGPENIIDTRGFPKFLEDISNASKIHVLSKGLRDNRRRSSISEISDDYSFSILFESGSYSVILADNTAGIRALLKDVPDDKRPTISDELLNWLGEYYTGCQFAVCCWKGSIEAEPLLWWYEPTDSKRLFIPTMDAHDGSPPRLLSRVQTDHIISVPSECGQPIRYSTEIPAAVRHLLPTHIAGTKVSGYTRNGDSWVNLDAEIKDVPVLVRGNFMAAKDTPAFEERSRINGWR